MGAQIRARPACDDYMVKKPLIGKSARAHSNGTGERARFVATRFILTKQRTSMVNDA
jgi:hypothetical protein